MVHFYNSSIIDKQTSRTEDLCLTYRLFENGTDGDYVYSALITMKQKSQEHDFYISELASDKSAALNLFRKMHSNFVLPSETKALFSDGVFEY